MGYCLLYLEGYIEVDSDPTQVCLAPGEPSVACHNANAFINVEEAAGRAAVDLLEKHSLAGFGEDVAGVVAGRAIHFILHTSGRVTPYRPQALR
jgi:hypothetical protein